MKIADKIFDALTRRQNWLVGAILFLFCSLVAIRFDRTDVRLIWSDRPVLAMLLALVTAILALLWVQVERRRLKHRIRAMHEMLQDKRTESAAKWAELSPRQSEVMALIREGKSNKEICNLLHIGESTLKSHINQSYRILGIGSRKEARSLSNA
ncbi:MAG: LuxR C-terminal-related transcriptional regulator [Marinilabiliales bacterium]|nr:LuxR C-terminal-related transcriptional regulator [Marinilabiliales bacterium]